MIDINYLVHSLNTDGNELPIVQKFAIYDPMTKSYNYRQVIMNNKYLYSPDYDGLQFDYDKFLNKDTIIIKSCTGTGKTTAISTHMAHYLKEDQNKKFITLTTRRTLSDQHCFSFQNINLQNYRELKNRPEDEECLTICINRFDKLDELDDEVMNDYVL